MSELDGLEEIDLTAHVSTGSGKRRQNARKQLRKLCSVRHTSKWKCVLRGYQAKKAKKAK